MDGSLPVVLLGALSLAGAAGLNAWIPLLVCGIAARSGGLELAEPFDELASTPALVLVGVGLVVDFVADKVPAIDSVVHAVGTVVNPAAGAIVAAGGAGADVPPWLALLAGALTAEGIHLGRATVRPIATTLTAGMANPLVSLTEDTGALGLSLLVLVAPIAAAVLLLVLVVLAVRLVRRARRRRRPATASG